MKTEYIFNRENAQKIIDTEFDYAFSPLHKKRPKFRVYDDFIGNYDNSGEAKQSIHDYDYVSLISKKKFRDGAIIKTTCTFEKFGAPIIVICDDLKDAPDGTKEYGVHFEVCVFQDGCNVWHLLPFPQNPSHPVKPLKSAYEAFKLENNEKIDITVEVKGKFLHIDVNGHKFVCGDPIIPDEFYVGITACEGNNTFSHLTIEE